MVIDYILDTSSQHPKIKNEDQKEEFLVEYSLHVDGEVYNLHGLIWAKDSMDALTKMEEAMPEHSRQNHHVTIECVVGAVKDEERRNIHDKLHDIGGGIILP